MWSCSWKLQTKQNKKVNYMQKRLFIQYKPVFNILHLKIPSVKTLTLLKPHIFAFTTLLQTKVSWESDCAFNLSNNRKKRNITISILSSAGASRQHK